MLTTDTSQNPKLDAKKLKLKKMYDLKWCCYKIITFYRVLLKFAKD